jgi:hypothetical protein
MFSPLPPGSHFFVRLALAFGTGLLIAGLL